MEQPPIIDYSNLTDEQITDIRKQLPRKKKYQKKTIEEGGYRQKKNPTRTFSPDEWEKFIYIVEDKWKPFFWLQFLLGTRFKESNYITINDFDFKNRQCLIRKPKGIDAGKTMRYVQLSSFAVKYIRSYIKINDLRGNDDFKFPTIQGMIGNMRKNLKLLGIEDYKDFSIHNIRKTHENYLVSLDVNDNKLLKHMGHTQKTANEHYLSGSYIKEHRQLELVRKWLGDALTF